MHDNNLNYLYTISHLINLTYSPALMIYNFYYLYMHVVSNQSHKIDTICYIHYA